MPRSIRPKLTFANAMVAILTFVVLGGGAYAATSLPRNSVGTKQLKNGAVTQKKIGKAAQKALRGATGPQGPVGPPGPQGPKGDGAAPGGTIPVGVTLRGAADTGITTGSPGINNSSTGVSFGGFQLPSRPAAHVVPVGGSATPACPGSVAAPEATSGNLCVYLVETVPAGAGQVIVIDPSIPGLSGINYNIGTAKSSAYGDGTVARFGFHLGYSQSTSNSPQLRGTWAVTG